METIRVNMTPCEDVQTIHASQNDNEAREWGFILHNDGDVIDSSEITDQMVFKAYEGGTEQILPENGSTPTTSPFKGDIKYPQGLLSDQEFLYRESPTEEDGLAKITDIKGNTLVWNQQVESLLSTQEYEGITFTNNGDGSLTLNGTLTNTSAKHPTIIANTVEWYASHRYLIDLGNTTLQPFLVRKGTSADDAFAFARKNPQDSNSPRYLINGANIGSPLSDGISTLRWRIVANSGWTFNNVKIIPQIFDLTKMFGSTKAEEIYQMEVSQAGSGVAYFRSLYPLPYYSYNQGTLLSFMGNGIKTVGKNQLDPSDAVGLIGTVAYSNDTYTITYSSSGDRYVGMNIYRRGIPLDKLLPKKYTLSFDISGISTTWAIGLRNATNNSFLNSAVVSVNSDGHYSLTIDLETNNQTEYYLSFVRTGNQTSALTVLISNVMFEIGNTETSYEPYTSSTLSLPISTYFTNGMKSAGNVYDELTETKAITRMGTYTFTSALPWVIETISGNRKNFYVSNSQADRPIGKANSGNIICDSSRFKGGLTSDSGNIVCMGSTGLVQFRTPDADLDTLEEWRTFLESNPITICYELPSPIETSFTTASLVTENGETPLSNEDGVLIGKCTEQLSAEPGFHDAKIKLADEDGECYSNKIQLHVERSPQ